MLYISRRIDSDHFGVVDTDDGVETICSHANIYYACVLCDVEIKGVTLTVDGKYVAEVVPYNAKATLKQVKTLILHGVSIVVCNDEIVDISVPTSALLHNRVDIVLSEYAKSCGSCITQNLLLAADFELHLVLDDTVSIKPDTFLRIFRNGLFIDITAVRRIDTINMIYGLDCQNSFDTILSHIIDVSWRFEDYQGVPLVRYGPDRNIPAKQYNKLASAKVEAIFIEEFKSIFNAKLKIGRTKGAKRAHEEFISASTFNTFSYYIRNDTVTYRDSANFAETICTWLRRAKVVDAGSAGRLMQYIYWFTPTLAFQKAYTKFCIRVVKTYMKE